MASEENKNVRLEWFDLVDDLEKFNEYPWGKSSYELTTKLLKRDLQSTFTRKNKYSMHGFPLSIMVWALEAIPSIAKLAEKLDEVNVPRLLNWKVDKNLKAVDIVRDLEGEHVDVEEKLQPTEAEKQQPYWVALEHYLEGVAPSQQADTKEVVPVLDYELMKDVLRSVVEEKNKKVYYLLDKIEAKIDRIEGKVDKLSMSFRTSVSRGVKANMDDVNMEQPVDKMIDVENRVFEVVDAKRPRATSTKRKYELVASAFLKPARLYLDPTRRRKVECVTKYDPFWELDPAKCDFLYNWLKKITNESEITMDIGYSSIVSAKVLSGLLTSGWLSTVIMNASLTLIRKRMKSYPNLFQQDACVMDSYFFTFVCNEYVKLKKVDVKDYNGHAFPGKLINWANGVLHKKWKACRYLYAPVCKKLHWVAIQIDLEEA